MPPAPPDIDAETAADPHPPTQQELGVRIQKAGATVLVPHLIIKFAGLFANWFIPNHYGKAVAETFKVINDSVLNVAFLFGEQCLAPAYLPLFTRAREEGGEAHAWRFTSILFNLQLLVLLVLVSIFMLFPEWFVRLLTEWAGSSDPELVERHRLFLVMLPFAAPGLLGMSLASLTYVVLNGYKEFFFAAFGDALLKLSILGGAAIGYFIKNDDWRFLAGGAVFGGTLKLATHLFALGWKRMRKHTWTLDATDKYVKMFGLLILPLLAGVAISQGRDVVITRALTSQANLKLFYGNGRTVVDSIQFIIPYTLSIALLPFFCDLSAREDNARLGAVLTQSIRILVWFLVPVGIAIAAAALPVSSVLYEGAKYTKSDVGYTAHVSSLYAAQLPFAALEMMVMQAFFSSKRVITPTIVGLVFSALSAGTAYVGVKNGLVTTPWAILTLVALAAIFSRILKSLVLVAFLRRSVPVLPVIETLGYVLRVALAGAAAGAAAYAVSKLNLGGSKPAKLVLSGVIAAVTFAVFLGASLALRLEEPKQFLRWTREKLNRRGKKK